MGTLKLLACHAGTGEAGSDFLFALAQASGHNVAGPTGFVYCAFPIGGVWFEDGSQWQVATPTYRPAAIGAPSLHLNMDQKHFVISEPSAEGKVSIDRVTSVTYRRTLFQGRGSAPITLTAEQAQALLTSVDFSSSFGPGGTPLALVTGILTIKYLGDSNTEAAKDFRVYNDRLLEDPESPGTFYRAAPAFKQAVDKLGGE